MRARYSKRESLNRILRLLEGKAVPTDVPGTVSGQVLSEDEAFSDIAELMANSLPNEALSFGTYGEVKNVYSGTASYLLFPTAGTIYELTGSFGSVIANYGITTSGSNTRLIISQKGAYHVWFRASYQGSPDLAYQFSPFIVSPSSSPTSLRVFSQPSSSGSYTFVAGDFYLLASGTFSQTWGLGVVPVVTGAWMITHDVQFGMQRIDI